MTQQHPPRESRQELLNDAMIAPSIEVSGLELRPLSMGSFLYLKKTNNRLYTQAGKLKDGESNVLDYLEDLLAFVFIHAEDEATVARLVYGAREDFDKAVAVFGGKIDINDLPELAESIQNERARMDAATVDPRPNYDEDDDPNEFGQSGQQA